MEPEVSIGEVQRTVARVEATVTALALTVNGILERLDERYQRRDLAEAEAANFLARIQSVVDDVNEVKADMDEDRRARTVGTRWGIGLALTAIGLVISATAILVTVLPSLVKP